MGWSWRTDIVNGIKMKDCIIKENLYGINNYTIQQCCLFTVITECI